MQEGLILCRFLHFGAVLLLFGSGLFRHGLFKSALPAFEASERRLRADRQVVWLAGLALLTAVGWLMLTAANMTGAWRDAIEPSTLALVMGHTFFGRVWAVHLALGLLVLVWAFSRTDAAPRQGLLLSALLLLTLAPVGHGAMFDGVRGQLLILNQMLHLIGVGTWLGGLWMLAVLLAPPHVVDLRPALLRFSGIGYGLVAVIIATGLVNVRALSGAVWPEPAFSGFGGVLAVKVALVVCMLVLAGLNRTLTHARVLNTSALRVSVLLECLFGGAALAAVSLLGTLPPILG